jgi:hypothetical protein
MKFGKITFSHPDVVETEAPEETGTSEEELGTSEHVPIITAQVPNVYNT